MCSPLAVYGPVRATLPGMRPTPKWDGSRWTVDLRTPWRLGRHVIQAPAPPAGLVEAVHASRDLLERLRPSGLISQPMLPGVEGRSIAQAFEAWLEARSYRKPGGERWVRLTAAAISREIGSEPLLSLAPPEGTRMLARWVRMVRTRVGDRTVGPRAMADRLSVLRQMCAWCAHAERLWLPALPTWPDPRIDSSERMHNPQSDWTDEANFRRVRDAIYGGARSRALLERHHGELGAVDLIHRRRLFLSVGFYAGMRRADLESMQGGHVSPDCSCIVRHSSKCSVDPVWERVCPPLVEEFRKELARLGRPWRRDELICGDVWRFAPRVIAAAAKDVGGVAFDLRTLRRSFVRMKALAGVSEPDLMRLMGHASDSRMVRSVYLRVPPPGLTDPAGEAWPECSPTPAPRRLRLVPSESGILDASQISVQTRR